jgi:hypothetical protein
MLEGFSEEDEDRNAAQSEEGENGDQMVEDEL